MQEETTKQTITYVDSYGFSHSANVEDLTTTEFLKVLINIMRFAQYDESSIGKALEESSLDF